MLLQQLYQMITITACAANDITNQLIIFCL